MIDFYSDDIPSFFKKPQNYHVRSPLLLTYPLNYAAARGDIVTVRELLKRGVNVDSRGDMNETPLYEAIESGSADVAEVLLDAGASLHTKSNFGKSPMDLLNASVDLNIIHVLEKARRYAQPMSKDELINFYSDEFDLENNDLDLNAVNDLGERPIHVAVKRGERRELNSLIENGVYVDLPTEDGMEYTALHYAAGVGDFDALKILLKNNARWDILDGFGRTAIDLMYLIGDAEQIFYINEFINQSANNSSLQVN